MLSTYLILDSKKQSNMKKISLMLLFISSSIWMFSCGGSSEKSASSVEAPKSMVPDAEAYDPKRGEGKFNESNVQLGALDAAMAKNGEVIANTKCLSCHKLTDERLVGPGWKGVSERRTPYWLMNFITNPDPMIDKDPEVQAQLELCLVRMPNQNLTDDEARSILEFMRKNDGAK